MFSPFRFLWPSIWPSIHAPAATGFGKSGCFAMWFVWVHSFRWTLIKFTFSYCPILDLNNQLRKFLIMVFLRRNNSLSSCEQTQFE